MHSLPLPHDLGLHVPFFREGQYETIQSIATSHCRFPILHAPTGSGKSIINLGAANLLSCRTLYLTQSKILQDQLDSYGLSSPYDIRGHSNYPCARSSPSYSDDIFECLWGSNCVHAQRSREAAQSRLVKSNYSNWITILRSDNPNRLGKFDLLILDEAHLAHDILVDQLKCTIKEIDANKYLSLSLPIYNSSLDRWKGWLREATIISENRLALEKDRTTRGFRQRLNRDINFLDLNLNDNHSEFVIEHGISDSVTFTPVWGKWFSERYLFNNIPTIVLCSATIHLEDLPELGIPIDPIDSRDSYLISSSYDWIEVESTFPSHHSPFIYSPSSPELYVDWKMPKDDSKVNLWVGKQDSLISDRLDRKGIIHTWSYEWSKLFMRESRHNGNGLNGNDNFYPHVRLISHRQDNSDTRRAEKEFRDSIPPSLLISPSFKEGADFPDSLCRYQILPKIPFLNKKYPVNKARLRTDPTYTVRRTCRTIEQMAGRGMRHKKDFCENIVTDAYWKGLRDKYRHYFSSWFVKCWRVDARPKPLNVKEIHNA